MSCFEVVNIVLSYSRILRRQIFNFIEIMHFMFGCISIHL